MAIQNGIVYFENHEQKLKTFQHATVKGQVYQTPAKSIFKKGCEVLIQNIFFFDEFYLQFNHTIQWVAEKLKPKLSNNYTL